MMNPTSTPHPASPDELYTLRAQYWLGHYNLAIEEAKTLSRKIKHPEKDEFLARAQVALGQRMDQATTPGTYRHYQELRARSMPRLYIVCIVRLAIEGCCIYIHTSIYFMLCIYMYIDIYSLTHAYMSTTISQSYCNTSASSHSTQS